jgi:hypothetical protein
MVATTRAEAVKAVQAIFERYVSISGAVYGSRLLSFICSLSGFLNISEVLVILISIDPADLTF